MPDEVKLAREKLEKPAPQQLNVETAASLNMAVTASPIGMPITSGGVTFSSVPVVETSTMANPIPSVSVADANKLSAAASASPVIPSIPTISSSPGITSAPGSDVLPEITGSHVLPDRIKTSLNGISEDTTILIEANKPLGTSTQDLEDGKNVVTENEMTVIPALQEKENDEEQAVYANKEEAKSAFLALLRSVNVRSDWTWDQAMRLIINDKRYAALKTLVERKQVFNEYLSQRKKHEAEERRTKQKKSKEDFMTMLKECKEITSMSRWSKVASMLEGDERFSAVERPRDREDLFESFVEELAKKEKAKAAEEYKRNVSVYRVFLRSCDFIKANSQWRKVQDRLEEDERCSRLERLDRLKIFQEYLQDLEKEEEEQKKIQKEQVRREERKNRDEFRKLMEEHVAAGILTFKSHWHDYFLKVKELPAFVAVSLNASGATPKELFVDVTEELEKQYNEDKSEIKDAVKMGKINLTSKSKLEDIKAVVLEGGKGRQISEINLKLIFDELLERVKEKEEKEAKKHQRLVDNFNNLLYSRKEINASSRWEEVKQLIVDCQEHRSIGEESLARELFEGYVSLLREKAKEKERKKDEEKARREREEKDRRKDKERKERDRDRLKEKEKEKEKDKEKEKERSRKDDVGNEDDKDERRREKDRDRRHQKRHHRLADEVSSEQEEKDGPKKSRRHNSDRKRSRKHESDSEGDSEKRQKRHKKERDASRRSRVQEELEDGELGEDGEFY